MKIKRLLSLILSFCLLVACGALFSACLTDNGGLEISFDANGGVLSERTFKIETGEKIKFPEITREGYKFNCWVYEFGDELNIIKDGDVYEFRSSVTIKATWVPNGAYAITYDLDGGSMSAGNPFYYTTDGKDVNLFGAKKQGYTFIGWSGTDIQDVSTYVCIKSGSRGDKSYKANYFTESYTVNLVLTDNVFNPDSGREEVVQCTYNGLNEFSIENVKYGTTLDLSAPSIAKTDYYFEFWYYIKDGKEIKFVPTGEVGATVFNMYTFTDKNVYIYVKCQPYWTKEY